MAFCTFRTLLLGEVGLFWPVFAVGLRCENEYFMLLMQLSDVAYVEIIHGMLETSNNKSFMNTVAICDIYELRSSSAMIAFAHALMTTI